MRGKQTHFFATRGDLEKVIQTVETTRQLKYIRFGLFDDPNPVIYESFLQYEDLGINKKGQASTADIMFLIFDKSSLVIVEPIPQIDGGTKYEIASRHNPESIVFAPSGVFDEKALIAGVVQTASTDTISLELYSLFRKTILKNSRRIGYAYVCDDALEFMKNGGRMVTMGVDSPREYDLKFQ